MNAKLPYGKQYKSQHKKICWQGEPPQPYYVSELINSLQLDTAEMPLFAQTDFVIKHSGLYGKCINKKKAKKAEVRIENLEA